MRRFLINMTCVALAIGLPLAATAADNAAARSESTNLFRFADTEAIPATDNPGVVESRFIEVNTRVLNLGEKLIQLPTLSGTIVDAALSDFDQRGLHQTTWRGWIGGVGHNRVILSLHEGYVAGVYYTDDGVYEILPTRDGQVVNRIDHRLFDRCAEGSFEIADFVPPPEQKTVTQDGPQIETADTGGATNESEDSPEFDAVWDIQILTVYTPDARDAAGSSGAIEATVRAAIDTANTAFMDSDMDARFHLANTAIAPDSYNDSGDIGADLTWMDGSANLALLRAINQADMVSLITENGGGFCGLAHVQRTLGSVTPYQVTARGCTVGNLSWAHEHGHNQGFEHDPANGTTPANALTTYAFAHFVDGSYRTVMSYSSECTMGCTRVAHFSNPDIEHNEAATGIASQRDNAATGDYSDYTVANFVESTGKGKTVAQYASANRSWNDASFSDIKSAVEQAGHTVTANGTINGGILNGADVLLVGEVTINLSSTNERRIRDWVRGGGLLLMTNEDTTSETFQNEWLAAAGSSIRRDGSGSGIGPFPFVPDFIEGPPYNLANQTASTSLGSHFTGGLELAGVGGRFEYIGAGAVVALGERLDHNVFIDDPTFSFVTSVNTKLFLNLIENGPQSTKHTSMLAGNAGAGVTFDLYNQTDTARMVNGFGVNINGAAGETETVAVYYRVGTANGYESNRSAWTLLGRDFTVVTAGPGELSRVKIEGLVLPPYTTYGIYLDLKSWDGSNSVVYTNSDSPVVYSFGDLRLTTYHGKGIPAFTGSTFVYRQFNGTVYYTTVPWNTTEFNNDNSFAGNMFDIQVDRMPVKVRGFNVNLSNAGASVNIKAWYRAGTCDGHQDSSAGWTYLGADTVISNGSDIPTPININGPTLAKNSLYGFYLQIDPFDSSTFMNYNNGGPNVYPGDDLSITTYHGKADPPFTGDTFTYRAWNGTVFYEPIVLIFADGFESGNPNAWTDTVP